MMNGKKGIIVAVLAAICLTSTIFALRAYGAGKWPYNPWWDINDDGRIDIQDLARVSGAFGTWGQNITKAAVEFDSGWIDITDKAGEHFSVTHNLDDSNVIVDITGKMTVAGNPHQRHLGGTDYVWRQGKAYGTSDNEEARSVIACSDGGYAMCGYVYVDGRSDDIFLVKTDSVGNMQWNRTFGGTGLDYAWSMIQTADSGFALVGWTYSFGAGGDMWLIKTHSNGTIEWSRTYGGTNTDSGYALIQLHDGGYVLAGDSMSYGTGDSDAWLVRTDSSGNLLWSKTYGGTKSDQAYSLIQTSDGGYALGGCTYSYGQGGDYFLVKTDADGNMQWSRSYGTIDTEGAYSLVQTNDGGYALFGTGRVSGSTCAWLVRTGVDGTVNWDKTYRDPVPTRDGQKVISTADGGFMLAGNAIGGDGWLARADDSGSLLWVKTYGGKDLEEVWSMSGALDGGYLLAGRTNSFGHGLADNWLIKIESNGNPQWVDDYFKEGLAWTDSSTNAVTLYRGTNDPYWNYVRVRIWKMHNP